MGTKKNTIVVINAGSSSIKFAVYGIDGKLEKLSYGAINGIQQADVVGTLTNCSSKAKKTFSVSHGDFLSATQALVYVLNEEYDMNVVAIGHRVVHGGSRYSRTTKITDEVFSHLQDIVSLDPDHMPSALILMRELNRMWPDAQHVACFDTAFFRDMPRIARIIPLPRRFEQMGVKRYGFHGLSYEYVQSQFEQFAGPAAASGRVIYAHLGSGASLTATLNRRPMDTTMGFSPASGIVMSTRSGDLDPTIGGFLEKTHHMSAADYSRVVNQESGLLGVSGTSADMYTLLQREHDDVRAAEAVQLFCYQVRKAIGSLSAVLGGLDSLVFTGGIGEQSALIRTRICSELGYLGVSLDYHKNEQAASLISSEGSAVGVHVISTDESKIIAEEVYVYINQHSGERE